MFKIYNVLRELNVSVKYQQAAGQGSNCFLVCVRIMKTCPVLHLYTRWINLCDIWCNWTWIVYCSLKSKVPPLRFHRPASNAAQPLNVANKATHFHCLGHCLNIHSIIPPSSFLTSTGKARPDRRLNGNLCEQGTIKLSVFHLALSFYFYFSLFISPLSRHLQILQDHITP